MREVSQPTDRIGLVAGGGQLPFVVARAAKAKGLDVVCIGIQDEVSPELADEVTAFRSLGIGRLNATLKFFRQHSVRSVSWAGWIRKERIFRPAAIIRHLPDWRAIRFWFFKARKLDRQTQTLLTVMAEEFESEGFEIAHSAKYCPEILVNEGQLTKRAPTQKELEDIAFGWKVTKRMAELDVGQSVAVLDKATVAVEAMEGTDRNIERAGKLCRRPFTVVKLAMDGHDMRFDVPTVGPKTLETMREAGARVLAVEAEKTIVLEQDEFVRLANKYGMTVVALSGPPKAND
ncbi:MAG: UDP-2,3-diacylglucosamine diphosphatase LpxI [Planctomycetota bacterium]